MAHLYFFWLRKKAVGRAGKDKKDMTIQWLKEFI